MMPNVFSAQGPITPTTFWQSWNWDVPVVVGILLLAWTYNHGLARLWRRLGVGHGVSRRQAAAFALAIVTLVIALISPVEELSHTLFSGHMLQHMLLVSVAAPLLILSNLQIALLSALPRRAQQKLGRQWQNAQLRAVWHSLNHPVVTWSLFTLTFWIWHVPMLYQAALENDALHAAEHGLFLATAMLFWWTLFKPVSAQSYGMHVMYLFTGALQGSILGALLIFAGQPLYPNYASTVSAWHLTALQDQQLAGIVMWLPTGLFYLGLALGFFMVWLQAFEENTPVQDRW